MELELQRFIQDELATDPERPIGPDDELLLDGLVDSLGVMRLVTFVEERAGIRVPPEDVTIDNFRSIAVIAAYARGRKAAGSS